MLLYKYTDINYIQSCVENGVYASVLDNVNDPYEWQGIRYPERYRICCVTSANKKMLMWAYYCRHAGCCIQYEVPNNAFKKVNYTRFLKPHLTMNDAQVLESLFAKGYEWRQELEYRAVFDRKNADKDLWLIDGDSVYFKAKVKQVIFGVLTDVMREDDYIKALEYLKNFNDRNSNSIKVKKMMLSNREYKLLDDKQYNYIEEIRRLNGK